MLSALLNKTFPSIVTLFTFSLHKYGDDKDDWRVVTTIGVIPDSAGYTQTVWDLTRDHYYRFRVDVHGDDDGAAMEAVPGVATDWIQVKCSGWDTKCLSDRYFVEIFFYVSNEFELLMFWGFIFIIIIIKAATNTPNGEYDTYHEYGVLNTNNYSQIWIIIINILLSK